ncbi:MAG: lasso peptide biosynthesis B2 protein [Granulosicoccus sp.]|nr:lasso peptide biosynthesis B2 protein [Granulosicoccus sp.]
MTAAGDKRILQRARNLLHRPLADKLLLLKVLVLLGATRLAINVLPFSRLERMLGKRMQESEREISTEEQAYARRIRWAVGIISPYTPWKSNCFPQALTAKILLRRRGISSTLYMGAAFKEEGSLQGHAWLRCGPYYLTGGDSESRFGAIASFAD